MWDATGDLGTLMGHALIGLAQSVTGAAPGWLALGLLLHLANQVARGRGWYALVRSVCRDEPRLRRRDAIGAWIAGAGVGGVATARGGDAVRILLLRRRLSSEGYPLLAGTIVAESAGELAFSAVLLATAIALGIAPALGASATTVACIGLGAAALVALAVAIHRVPRLRSIARDVARGCAPLRNPVAYARGVLPWQLASRACRLGALACFLTAFGLPATPVAVLLVLFAQGGGRLVPFAPASVGASAALLTATFGSVTGAAVPATQLAGFVVGTSTLLTVVGTGVALAICLRAQVSAKQLRTARPAPTPLPPVPAPAGAAPSP
jgi:hypothetical protein